MSAHTPGPWTSRGTCIYGSGAKVAEVPSRLTTPGATLFPVEATANARLIAAAPELLDALKAFCGDYESKQETRDISLTAAYQHALTIIAKAEGR